MADRLFVNTVGLHVRLFVNTVGDISMGVARAEKQNAENNF